MREFADIDGHNRGLPQTVTNCIHRFSGMPVREMHEWLIPRKISK